MKINLGLGLGKVWKEAESSLIIFERYQASPAWSILTNSVPKDTNKKLYANA